MANRFPLIFNSGAGQIQELAASDNLDLTSSNLVNAGILSTSSGSVTAPSISIGSGTTYPPGLYSPGTDQLAVATNGSGRVFVDSSGRVGLGVVSPGYPVDLVSQSGESIRIRGTSGTEISKLLFTSNSAGADYGWLSSASSYLAFGTAATERMRLTSTGLGIGVTSPGAELHVNPGSGNVGNIYLDYGTGSNADGRLNIEVGSTAVFYETVKTGGLPQAWYVTGSERMRISANGSVQIGRTGQVNTEILALQNAGEIGYFYQTSNSNVTGITMRHTYAQSAQTAKMISFTRDNGAEVGAITLTTTATAYGTSSDYRLKENVVAVNDGIIRLQQLKPSRFNFIVDPDKTVDGFIAHEVQSVVPEAITGTKDEVDADGKPVHQGIDQSKLVPLLTAALQEAISEINALKDRVAALEGA